MMSSKKYIIIGAYSTISLHLIDMLASNSAHVFSYSRSDIINSSNQISHLKIDTIHAEIPNKALPESVDGLVYFPGTISLKPFKALKQEDFINDLTINFLGAVKTIKQVLKRLNKSSSIVLFSSVAANLGMPFHTSVAASKGALEGFGKALAAELAPKTRVNIVAPSLTNTKMAEKFLNSEQKMEAMKARHPLNDVGDPKDIASAVFYLLSDASKWISGQTLAIDDGLSTLKL